MTHNNHYPYEALKLNNGTYMPILGFGTFLSAPGEVGAAVKHALQIGYRHIDCAAVYDNEPEIGKALKEVFDEGKIKREQVFITSKLPASKMDPSGVAAQLDKTLADLQLTYLDLYLVHQPVIVKKEGDKSVPVRGVGYGLQDVWRAMEAVYHAGKTKAIGVSNYPTALLNDVLCYAKVVPAVQQIERHPYLVQPKHVEFCHKNGIQVTAFGSLGAPGLRPKVRPDAKDLLQNDLVVAIAKKYGKTAAQVLIRWSIDTNVIAIPKSVKENRLEENFSVWDFKLTPEEKESLSALDENLRVFQQDWHTVPTFT